MLKLIDKKIITILPLNFFVNLDLSCNNKKKSSYLFLVAVDMWVQRVVALWAAGRLISEGQTLTHPSQSFERNRSPIFCFVILLVMVLSHYKTENEKRKTWQFLY